MTLDPREVARGLGGNVSGRNVVAPGPGHSRTDRSLSIKIDPAAPDGFIVYSFAGDDAIAYRDHVRAALGLSVWERLGEQPLSSRLRFVARHDDTAKRSVALRIWNEAHNPRGTVAANYLASRGLTLTGEVAVNVIRFHPGLKLDGVLVGGMVALLRDITTNETLRYSSDVSGQRRP